MVTGRPQGEPQLGGRPPNRQQMGGPLMHEPGMLVRAADAGHLTSLVEPASPLRPVLQAAEQEHLRPWQVGVLGRVGVGRDTMARALGERLSLAASDSADADLWVYVLAGLPRRADTDAIGKLPRDRLIVVLGKADTHGDWDTATSIARNAAHRLGVPVAPVSALLACAQVSDDDFATLRGWASAGIEMPSMAGRFLSGPPGSAERQTRLDLLTRLDQFGIDLALTLIGESSPAAADGATFTSFLHAASGISDLVEPLRAMAGPVRRRRRMQLRETIELAAMTGCDRDAAEALLADRPAVGAR